jgi:hypothetical protein
LLSGFAALAAAASLALLGACTPKTAPVPFTAPAGNWVSLFNGKDLDGWTVKIAGHDVGDNYRDTFRVEDGLLKVSYRQYDQFGGRFASLFFNKPLSHYWLRVQYRFTGDAAPGAPSWTFKNSGIQLHGQAPATMRKEQEFPVNVEFDLVGGRSFGSRPTGDVCRNGTLLKIKGVPLAEQCSKLSDITIRDDQWVTAEAEVVGGTRVRQGVNGVLVVEYTDLQLDDKNPDARKLIGPDGATALRSGYISLQGNGYPIEFRRIEILPIDDAAPAS